MLFFLTMFLLLSWLLSPTVFLLLLFFFFSIVLIFLTIHSFLTVHSITLMLLFLRLIIPQLKKKYSGWTTNLKNLEVEIYFFFQRLFCFARFQKTKAYFWLYCLLLSWFFLPTEILCFYFDNLFSLKSHKMFELSLM